MVFPGSVVSNKLGERAGVRGFFRTLTYWTGPSSGLSATFSPDFGGEGSLE